MSKEIHFWTSSILGNEIKIKTFDQFLIKCIFKTLKSIRKAKTIENGEEGYFFIYGHDETPLWFYEEGFPEEAKLGNVFLYFYKEGAVICFKNLYEFQQEFKEIV